MINKRRQSSHSDALLGFLLTLPVLALMLALVFYPLGVTFWDSLHRVDPTKPGKPFIGLEHYIDLFKDSEVRTAWANTFWYVGLAVLLETVFGLLAALLRSSWRWRREWLLVECPPKIGRI